MTWNVIENQVGFWKFWILAYWWYISYDV